MEVLPCSRVAHIERTKKPYNNDIDYYAKRNALRAAEVWMDDFKSHVYMAWNIPMTVSEKRAITSVNGGRELMISRLSYLCLHWVILLNTSTVDRGWEAEHFHSNKYSKQRTLPS